MYMAIICKNLDRRLLVRYTVEKDYWAAMPSAEWYFSSGW